MTLRAALVVDMRNHMTFAGYIPGSFVLNVDEPRIEPFPPPKSSTGQDVASAIEITALPFSVTLNTNTYSNDVGLAPGADIVFLYIPSEVRGSSTLFQLYTKTELKISFGISIRANIMSLCGERSSIVIELNAKMLPSSSFFP